MSEKLEAIVKAIVEGQEEAAPRLVEEALAEG